MADFSLGAQCVPGNAFALPYPLTRIAVEDHVEALIALLDRIDGDSDFEEDNEDMCAARDDAGGYHPNDGCGDSLPGDPLDIEETDEDCCEARDDDPARFTTREAAMRAIWRDYDHSGAFASGSHSNIHAWS